MEVLREKLKQLIQSRKYHKLWMSMISVMAGIVVFVTTYALILPAITLERKAAEEMAGFDASAEGTDILPESSVLMDGDFMPADGFLTDDILGDQAFSVQEEMEEDGFEDGIVYDGETVLEDGFLIEEEPYTEEELLMVEDGFTADEGNLVNEVLPEDGILSGGILSGAWDLPEDGILRREEDLPEEETLREEELLPEEETLREEELLPEEGFLREEEPLPEEGFLREEELLPEEELLQNEETLVEEELLPKDSQVSKGLEESEPADTYIILPGKEMDQTEEKLPEEETITEAATGSMQESNTEATTGSMQETITEAAIGNETEAVAEAWTLLTYEGKDYQIFVSYGEDAQLPEGAQLAVHEIREKTGNYKTYLEQSAEALGEEPRSVSYARFFDISIVKDGVELQPAEGATVDVQIRLADVKEQENDPQIIHFGEEAEVLEAKPEEEFTAPESFVEDMGVAQQEIEFAEETAEAENVICFETTGFSVFGVIYTVDFHFDVDGITREYCLDGGEKIALSELIEALGIIEETSFEDVEEFISHVSDVKFSDDSLVKVTHKTPSLGELGDEDWVMESLRPFDTQETLRIEMTNGDVIVVNVTDAQELTTTDITGLLADATVLIGWQEVGDAVWEVKKGEPYTIHLLFTEIPGSWQFNTNENLTYQLPRGFSVPEGITNQSFTLTDNDGNTYEGNTFSVSKDGLVTVTLTDEARKGMAASGNSKFTLDIEGIFDGSTQTLEFSDEVKRTVDVDDSHHLTVNKSGRYNADDDKVYYTVTVYSDGTSENVIVKDNITGTALTYDKNAVVSGNSSAANVVNNDSGFEVAIPSMKNGETVTITYTASVDHSKLTGKGTVEETGNNVTVKGKDDPGESKTTDLENTIDYQTLTKHSGTPTGEGYLKTVPWQIVVNEAQINSMAGKTITDRIGQESWEIMRYASDITIWVYDENGQLVETRKVTQPAEGAKTWSYKIPDSDGKYKYVIQYNTEVNVKGQIGSTTVTNSVTDGEHGTQGSSQVSPGENVNLTKTAGDIITTEDGDKTVTWTITFKVPKSGLNKAVVTDTYPTAWGQYFDTLVSDSVKVVGLNATIESYDVKEADDGHSVQIVFSKKNTDGETSEGLWGGSEDRTISITLTTKLDPKWLEDIPVTYDADSATHTNHVNLNDLVFAQASVTPPAEPGIKKTATEAGKYVNSDGIEVPIYRYNVEITGLTGALTLTDTFDARLRYLDFTNEDDNAILTAANAGNSHWDERLVGDTWGARTLHKGELDGSNPTQDQLSYTVSEAADGKKTLTYTCAADDVPKKDGSKYYDSYRITYYLIPENIAALNNEAIAATDATIKLNNTVSWNDKSDDASVTYEYPGLSKEQIGELQNGFATYRITINPNKAELNGGNPMEMTDTYTKLSVDYSTIKIYLNDSTEPDNGKTVTYNFKGSTGTYNIPDKTKVVIEYKARVVGEGTITYSNLAVMKSFRASTTNTSNISGSGGGSIENNYIRLYKYAEGDMTKPLNGTVYTLVDKNGNPILYPASAANGKAGQPITFTTGETYRIGADKDKSFDGYVQLFLNENEDGMSFQKDVTYYIKETTAPRQENGRPYQTDNIIYSFTISDHPNYNRYEYYQNDIMKVYDKPAKGVLEIKKTIEGAENLTEEQKKETTFTVTSSVEGFQDITISYADFTDGVYRLENLEPGIYDVTETQFNIDGYTHTKTHEDQYKYQVLAGGVHGTEELVHQSDESLQEKVEIEHVDLRDGKEHRVDYINYYTQTGVPITVKKVSAKGDIPLYGAQFQLFIKNGDNWVPFTEGALANTASATEDDKGKFTIGYENRNSGVTLTGLTNGEYKLVETQAPEGYEKTDSEILFKVDNNTVTYSGNITDVSYTPASDTAAATFAVKNEQQDTYTLQKVETGRLEAHLVGAEFSVYEYGSDSTPLYTLTTDSDGKIQIDWSEGYTDADGTKHSFDSSILYYVKETKAPVGYKLPNNPPRYGFYYAADTSKIPNGVLSMQGGSNSSAVNLATGAKEAAVTNDRDTTTLSVTKEWKDWNGSYITAPVSTIRYKVFRITETKDADGKVIDTEETVYPNASTIFTLAGAGSEWRQDDVLTNLPTGASEDGSIVSYYYIVKEVDADGKVIEDGGKVSLSSNNTFEVEYGESNKTANQKKIINRPESTQITVNKVWEDTPEDKKTQITVQLYRDKLDNEDDQDWYIDGDNGNRWVSVGQAQTFNAGNGWTYTFTKLQKGYTYHLKEYFQGSENFVSTISDGNSFSDDATVTLTNTYNNIQLHLEKVWADDGKTQRENVQVNLYRKNKAGKDVNFVRNIYLNAPNYTADTEWLEKGPADDPWEYYAEEEPNQNLKNRGYSIALSSATESNPIQSGTITFTNVQLKGTELSVLKQWKGDDPSERPDSVYVDLIQKAGTVTDGKRVTITVNSGNNRVDTYGPYVVQSGTDLTALMNYYVYWNNTNASNLINTGELKDVQIDGANYSQLTLTNITADTDVVINAPSYHGDPALQVSGATYATANFDNATETTYEANVELKKSNGYYHSWSDLPMYSTDGKTAYQYTVSEHAVDGYESVVSGGDVTSGLITVTNTKTESDKTSIKINKQWSSNDHGGNTEIKYSVYSTTTPPETVKVYLDYPVEVDDNNAGDGLNNGSELVEKPYFEVLKGADLELFVDHAWWDPYLSNLYEVYYVDGHPDNKATGEKTSVTSHTSRDVTISAGTYNLLYKENIFKIENVQKDITIVLDYEKLNAEEFLEPVLEELLHDSLTPVTSGSITNADNWTTTISNLPKTDEEGHPLYYFVYENDLDIDDTKDLTHNLTRFDVRYSHQYINASDSSAHKVTITNTIRPQYTWIQIKKQWENITSDEQPDSISVVLYRRPKNSTDKPTWYDKITITKTGLREIIDGTKYDTKLIDNWVGGWYALNADYEYYIAETNVDGTWYSESPYFISYKDASGKEIKPLEFGNDRFYKVETGAPANTTGWDGNSATIVNEKTDIHFEKKWAGATEGKYIIDDEELTLGDFVIAVQLKQYINGEENTGTMKGNDPSGASAIQLLDGAVDSHTNDTKYYEDEEWHYVWKGLRAVGQENGVREDYTYKVVETGVYLKSDTARENNLLETGIFTQKISADGKTITNTFKKSEEGDYQIQITKYIVDENGNQIGLAASTSTDFKIYRSSTAKSDDVKNLNVGKYDTPYNDMLSSYTEELGSLTVPVATSGYGYDYYYKVPAGMYTIEEDRSSIPQTVIDSEGNKWEYVSTHLETEYQWHTEDDTNKRHFSDVYKKDTDRLIAVPEVVGKYGKDAEELENKVLDFFAINVYKKAEDTKSDTMNLNIIKNWKDGEDTTAPASGSVVFRLHQVRNITTKDGTGKDTVTKELDALNSGYPMSVSVSAPSWNTTVKELPLKIEVDENTTVTYSYYLEEVSRVGAASAYRDVTFKDSLGGDRNHAVAADADEGTATIEVTNSKSTTPPDEKVITIKKTWLDQYGDEPQNHPDEVLVDIYRIKLPEGSGGNGGTFNSIGGLNDVIGDPRSWKDNNNEIQTDVIFYYNGYYYYVRQGQSVFSRWQLQEWDDQLDAGYMSGDHVTRLTGNIYTDEEVNEKAAKNEMIQYGDIAIWNGEYYVYRYTGGSFDGKAQQYGPSKSGNWSKIGRGNILDGVRITPPDNTRFVEEEEITGEGETIIGSDTTDIGKDSYIEKLYEMIDKQLEGTGVTWSDEDKQLQLYLENVKITKDDNWTATLTAESGYLYFFFEHEIKGYTITYGYEEYGVYDQKQNVEIVNQTEVDQKTVDLTVKKQWQKDGVNTGTWPEGYTVNYKVVQKAYIAGLTSTLNGSTFEYTYNVDKNQHLFDKELTSFTVDAGTAGALNATTTQQKISALPVGVAWSGSDDAESIAAKKATLKAGMTDDEKTAFEAKLEDGKSYAIGFVYEIVETEVKDASGNTVDFGSISAEFNAVENRNAANASVALTNDTTEIKVKKAWTKNGVATDWHAGAQVYFTVDKVTLVNGKEVDSTQVYPLGVDAKSEVLNSASKEVTVSNLPVLPDTGSWTAPDMLTDKQTAAGITAGQDYTVTYKYVVREDKTNSTPAGIYPYAVEAIQADNVYTITNDLTDIDVEKQWSGATVNGDKVTVQLYKSTTPPAGAVAEDKVRITVKVNEWKDESGNSTTAPTDNGGSITVEIKNGDTVVDTLTLTKTDWQAISRELPKLEEGQGYTVVYKSADGTVVKSAAVASNSNINDNTTVNVSAVKKSAVNSYVTFDVKGSPNNLWLNSLTDVTTGQSVEFSHSWYSAYTQSTTANSLVPGHRYSFYCDGNQVQSWSSNVTRDSDHNKFYFTAAEGENVVTLNAGTSGNSDTITISLSITEWTTVAGDGSTITTTAPSSGYIWATIKCTNPDPDEVINTIKLDNSNNWSAEVTGLAKKYDQYNVAHYWIEFSIDSGSTPITNITGGTGFYVGGGNGDATVTTKAKYVNNTSNARQASFLWDDEDDLQTVAAVRSVKAAPRRAIALATTDKVSVTGTTNTGTNTFGVNDIAKTGQMPPSSITAVAGTEIVLDGTQDTTGEYEAWKAKWSNLPTVDENGNRIYYYVIETSATKSGATSMSADYKLTNADYIKDASGNIIGIKHETITNTPGETGKIAVSANKAWNLSGGLEADNFAVEFTLYSDEACTQIVSTSNNPQTITGNGKATWTNLNPGTYYVKETKVSYLKNGTTAVLWDGTGTNQYLTSVDDATDTFTNSATSYAVQKRWMTVNGEWNKEYDQTVYFHLYRDGVIVNENGVPEDKVFTLAKNTTATGVADADNLYIMRFDLLPGGTYTVVECTQSGVDLSQEATVNDNTGKSHKLCPEKVALTDGSELDVTAIKNDLYHIKAQKNWAESGVTSAYYPPVTFILKRTTDTVTNSYDWSSVAEYRTETLAAKPAFASDAERTVDFGTMPKFDESGREYTYKVFEQPIAGYVSGDSVESVIDGIQTFTITNTPKTINLYVHKEWFEGETNVNDQHTDDVIAYDVYRQAYDSDGNKVGGAEKIALPNGVAGRLPVENKDGDGNITGYGWQETVSNLPMTGTVVTTENDEVNVTPVSYKYYVVETAFGSFTTEYYVENDIDHKSENADDPEHQIGRIESNDQVVSAGTFIRNNVIPVDFSIEKIEKGKTSVKLKGAKFSVQEINPDDNKLPFKTGSSVTEGTTDESGLVKFEGLTTGIYKVTELQSPDGYIMTGDNFFYIQVAKGKVSVVEKDETTGEWQKSDDSAMLRYNPNSSTATVANEPGVALPASGGPGTRLFTILGSILILGAGVLLWRRRRTI